ncbi:MAG: DUF4296 domain-containing protein [Muribaculaceae bacterium]|nr:DUF4296 domain-containing protein [Muribaculaceae bacterium]
MCISQYHAGVSRIVRHALPALSVLWLLLAGCDRRPDGVLSDSEMESLMTDMILADAYRQTAAGRAMPDSVSLHLGESVMKAHGVSYAELDSTYAWYARNLDDYYKLYGRVQKRVAARRDRIAGNVMRAEGQLANDIWSLPQHLTFSPMVASDAFVFELGGDAVNAGERLEWKMHLSGYDETSLLLGVDYSDGAVSVMERTFRNDRKPSLSLVTDTSRTVSRIFGVLTVGRRSMPVYADSIRLLKQPFDSTAYRNAWSQRRYRGPVSKTAAPSVAKTDSAMVSVRTIGADSIKQND